MEAVQNTTYRVSTVADLEAPLRDAFASALEEACGRAFRFRVLLSPGRYHDFNLSMVDPSQSSEAVVSIEGDAGGVVILQRGSLNIRAGRLLLRSFVLTDSRSQVAAMNLEVQHEIVAQRLAVVENGMRNSRAEALIRVNAVGDTATARLRTEHCWFVANGNGANDLFAIHPSESGASFNVLNFRDCTFVSNRTRSVIRVCSQSQVVLEECLAIEPLVDSAFEVPSQETAVTLFDSNVKLGATHVIRSQPPGRCSPVAFRGGLLRLANEAEAGQIHLRGTQLVIRALDEPNLDMYLARAWSLERPFVRRMYGNIE